MPLLTMLQEIHYKLMTRMTTRRDEMLNTNLQICPRIKKKLDFLVTESRKWSATWDGAKKFQVKSGTRSVTVDLENGSCDCRMYDLTGIPCHHAIAAIHSRRQEPLDYVSEYYKRDKYLATYKFSLEAMKGEEYWDFHSTETMLPPDIPKKLRGRPKKMRRREEWEGGSRSQATPSPGVLLQRFTNKRVMHCSNCRLPGHRVSKCPTKKSGENEAAPDEEASKKRKDNTTEPVNKSTKEKKRQKLAVRRPQKGIKINEPQTQSSQTGAKKVNEPPYKGKGKLPMQEEEKDDSDESEIGEEDVWRLFEQDYTNDEADHQEREDAEKCQGIDDLIEETISTFRMKQKKAKAVAKGGTEGVQLADDEPLAFFKKVPRKKMPLVKGKGADEWEVSGKDYAQFSEKLRGPVGTKAVFMPTPGLVPFRPPRCTPPANIPPTRAKQSSSSPEKRTYAFRLNTELKRLSGFKNSLEDPINLAE
ncbi:uncharacterized protein LOC141660755 [Apium graveolens]|uniref:uncharacterized protein LOC141660755 n=1 Tax=Apium graveolens TaxID=4045 RepID=UPI003D7AB265